MTDPKTVSTKVVIEEVLRGGSFVGSMQLLNDVIVIPDAYKTYLKTLRPGEEPHMMVIAKDSHALQSVPLIIDNKKEVDSVVDPGSQIVAMSEEVCHQLALTYDPNIKLNMQSANGSIDQSLGLACNVPCKLGPITLY